MIQVLFYGDCLDDGTREWLETMEYSEAVHLTSRMYKNIVFNLDYLRDYATERKFAKACIFSGDKFVCSVETRAFDFDDKDMIFISVRRRISMSLITYITSV